MRILGIETSCDETAAAVVEDGVRVRSNVVASSQEHFTGKGGVIPEEAARKQVECVMPVIGQALREAGCTATDIDAVAVTRGPGLLGSLLVGAMSARVCARVWRCPLVGVHHTLGHLSSVWLEQEAEVPSFPALALSASGGHTELWLRTAHTRGRLLGRTRDDAAGEAFDKGAALLGLPYPGGPSVSRAGAEGDSAAFPFPLPLHHDASLDFSFSGLKTSLRYILRDLPPEQHAPRLADLAASYEHALCAHLTDRVRKALSRHPEVRELHLAGGVSANIRLRSELAAMLASRVRLRVPVKNDYCTDNAAMIAAAGFFQLTERPETADASFDAEASLPLEAAVGLE